MNHDWSVRGVEKLDGVSALLASDTIRLQRQFYTEALQENNDEEDHKGCQKVRDVWQVGAEEGLTKGTGLIGTSNEQVDQSDNGALKLSA